MGSIKYIPLHENEKILQLVKQPVKLIFPDEIITIPKPIIVCDICNAQVATNNEEIKNGLPRGYAVCDEGYIYEVVCDNCLKQYYGSAQDVEK
jgi:uncharacterized protein with PIN domain